MSEIVIWKMVSIRLFRIMSIPIMFRLFRVLMSEMFMLVTDAVDYMSNCNMEMPRNRLSKYWYSVPHCLSDNRNISRQIVFLSRC